MPWVYIDDLPQPMPSKREVEEIEEYLRRKKKPRFYADENFPEQAIAILREWGADVSTAKQANKLGHPDEDHLAEARSLGRILITCDRHYLDNNRFPLIHCPALVVFDFGSGTRNEIIRAYQCLASIFRAPQFYDRWIKIDAKRDEWTEIVRFHDGSTSWERYRLNERRRQVWMNN